jgi:Xaa-Pro aminopeptidase
MAPDAVAILFGARLASRSADTHYPFRQDSDFLYLTGFTQPNAIAVLRTDGGPAFTLFVEPRVEAEEIWTGIRPGVDGAKRDFGADDAHPITEFAVALPKLIGDAKTLYYVPGRDKATDAQLVRINEQQRLRSRAGGRPTEAQMDPRAILHEMRLFKDAEELDTMRRAAAITCEAHRQTARLARDGAHEYELSAQLDYEFRRRGAAGPAYESIVGGGANATILHYINNDQPLCDGDLLLIDAGCELAGYASDVTRTYPVGGSFQGAKRDIYEIVLRAQQAAIEAAKPGGSLEQIHSAALEQMVSGLIQLNILKGSIPELIEKGAYKPYYMHKTSHWLGLDVHDVGAYTMNGEARKLEQGMVFTVEPGLYIPATAEEVPLHFRGIGVRIEDDLLVTPDGIENLTDAIPTQTDEVEAWVRDS